MNIVVLSPRPLNSMEEIKLAFGVGADKVRAWVKAGAPIAVGTNAKGKIDNYSAEYNGLQAWRVEYSRTRRKAG